MPEDYSAKVINYVKQTKRVVVEMSTKKDNNNKLSKTKNDIKPNDPACQLDGRMKGFLDSL